MAAQPAPLYIVASPRPRAGKTLLARLLMEYVLDNKRPLVGFDLNAHEPVLTDRFPALVWPVDIGDIRGQMELFDRLVADTASTKIVDVGYPSFERFFAVMSDIGFAQESRRCGMDTVVLFLTDPAIATARVYATLRQSLPVIFQPVHNEAGPVMRSSEDFPPTRAEYGTMRLPRLSQIVRGVVDRPSFSFNAYLAHQPGGPTEIHSWIAHLYTQFRDFELRLLMARLNSSLRWASLAPWPPAVGGRWSPG